MNKYTEAAAAAADRALASHEGAPNRATALAEAAGFATVGDAIDRAGLVVLERAKTKELATELFDLVPREDALDLNAVSEDARGAIEAIVEADTSEAHELGVALYPLNAGPGYDAQRIEAGAAVLGLGDDERSALAAWYGYTLESRPGWTPPADVENDVVSDAGGQLDGFDGDFEVEGADKAAKKAKKKGGKK